MSGDVEARVKTAKLFWSERSRAVRLPKEFRFQGEGFAFVGWVLRSSWNR